MKHKIFLIVATFVAWTLVFVLQKPVFLLMYGGGMSEMLPVVGHGLPLDLSMAGYLTAIPALLLLLSDLPLGILQREGSGRWWRLALAGYFGLASLAVALSFVANIALYAYWRFPLDNTPLFFLTSSPADAIASISLQQGLLAAVAIVVVAALVSLVFHLLYLKAFGKHGKRKMWPMAVELLLLAALFLPIRGGITVSSMNTGKAYFSQKAVLNHAAVNPLFSFMESVAHQEDFGSQYRFMDDKRAHLMVANMNNRTALRNTDKIVKAGNTQEYPDVYLIIMESFSDTVMHAKTADANGRQVAVTPNLLALRDSGVYFSRFYANSFRTDRGLLSILMGYPAPATVSLMKYPKKTAAMPSIAQQLAKAPYGYSLKYYYGGDADFTNMRSFLVNQGFSQITSDVDFPVTERLSKWGVPDHLLFARATADLHKPQGESPTFCVIQTSSSHEPFDVPYHHLQDKTLNAFAYADSCIGRFVSSLQQSGRWNRSLVILVPDHLGAWPKDIDNFKPWRFHCPMVWTGGAVKNPMVIDTWGSQQDIAATLLGQLGSADAKMKFSKDMLDRNAAHYAFFLMNDGFGMADDDNVLIYDNKLQRAVYDEGPQKGKHRLRGMAYLQVLFDDIANR